MLCEAQYTDYTAKIPKNKNMAYFVQINLIFYLKIVFYSFKYLFLVNILDIKGIISFLQKYDTSFEFTVGMV